MLKNIEEIRGKFKSMKVVELRKKAKELGVVLGKVNRKADIIEKIMQDYYITNSKKVNENQEVYTEGGDSMKLMDITGVETLTEEKTIDEILESEGITQDVLKEIESLDDEIVEFEDVKDVEVQEEIKDNDEEEVDRDKTELEEKSKRREESTYGEISQEDKVELGEAENMEVELKDEESKNEDEPEEKVEKNKDESNIEIKEEVDNEIDEITESDEVSSKRVELDIDKLDDSPFNFFKPISEKKFKEMVESISVNGVLQPIIVRPKDDGRYEILAGHNRRNASIEAGKEQIPAIIVNADDDKAKEIIVDTNVVQRDEKTPMEIARAYKIKAEAIGKRQGVRVDLNGGKKGLTRDIIGQEYEVSGMTVERYLRLNNLLPEFQELVDNGIMKVKTAFELGLVDEETQGHILDLVDVHDKDELKQLSTKKVKEIKKNLKEKNKLSKEEKKKFKEEGKEPEHKSLTLDEVKDIVLENKNVEKDLVLKIKVPADYDKETREFIEGNILSEPEWFLNVIKDIAHGKITI